jgi:hypothetical protein
MVLSGDMIRPLLDEIQHRLLELHRAVLNDLLNLVYERVTENHRDRSWHLFSKSPSGLSPLVQDSSLKLQKLKAQTLEDINKLRLLCCTNYDTAADVLSEAKAVVGELMQKLTDDHTSSRSSRFGSLPKSNVAEQITLSPPDKFVSTLQTKSPRSDSSTSSTRTGSSGTVLGNTGFMHWYNEKIQEARNFSHRSVRKHNNSGLIESEHPCPRESLQPEPESSKQSTKFEIPNAEEPAAVTSLPVSSWQKKMRKQAPVVREITCCKILGEKKNAQASSCCASNYMLQSFRSTKLNHCVILQLILLVSA